MAGRSRRTPIPACTATSPARLSLGAAGLPGLPLWNSLSTVRRALRQTFLFGGYQFAQLKWQRLAKMQQQVASEKPDYLLNVNQIEYIDHLMSEFEIEPVTLHLDRIEASSSVRLIPAERFPQPHLSSEAVATQNKS